MDYRRFENGYKSATDYTSSDHRHMSCGLLAFILAMVIVAMAYLAMNHSLAVVINWLIQFLV